MVDGLLGRVPYEVRKEQEQAMGDGAMAGRVGGRKWCRVVGERMVGEWDSETSSESIA